MNFTNINMVDPYLKYLTKGIFIKKSQQSGENNNFLMETDTVGATSRFD